MRVAAYNYMPHYVMTLRSTEHESLLNDDLQQGDHV